MGFKKDTAWAMFPVEILKDKRLNKRDIRVLLAYFKLTNNNFSLLGIKRKLIQEETGYPLSRVSEIKTNLEKLGWIDKENNALNLKGN